MRSRRNRLIAFAALLVVCLGGSAVVILTSGQAGKDVLATVPQSKADVTVDARALGSGGIVVFHDLGTEPGGTRGRIAYVPLSDPNGPRHLLGLTCGRVYFKAGVGTCMGYAVHPLGGYRLLIFNRRMKVEHSYGLPGVPSRTRVSADGRYASSTVFTTGDSYALAGVFSTRTRIYNVATGRALPGLESWRTYRDGDLVTAQSRNFWGVTFAPNSNTFYATLGQGTQTWLVRGDIAKRTMTTIHTNVQCPSVSPDGTQVAFKKAISKPAYPGAPVSWRFTVLDLKTGRETSLSETRSIDDQIEWLNDNEVLFGDGHNIYVDNANGSGTPRVLIRNADSPAVVSSGSSAT
jgi:hypothetical protein